MSWGQCTIGDLIRPHLSEVDGAVAFEVQEIEVEDGTSIQTEDFITLKTQDGRVLRIEIGVDQALGSLGTELEDYLITEDGELIGVETEIGIGVGQIGVDFMVGG